MAEVTQLFNPDQEHTLVLLKPDAYKRGLIGEVISRIERRGYTLVGLKITIPDPEILREHYFEHVEEHFYPDLEEYMCSGPIVAAVVEGDQVIKVFRSMMGATNPVSAEPGTIRGDLGRDWGNNRMENIVHGSDSQLSAAREIALWFPEFSDL